MAKFSVKAYQRRDGFVMIYVNNNENRVSVGISEDVKTSKLTAGQRKLLTEFERAIIKAEAVKEDFSSNSQTSVLNSGYLKLFITDNGMVDDVCVAMDGAYVATPDGRLLSLFEVENTMNGGAQ